jgi:1-pyrroline-4-hydroxy-2-carboxylate deaminase
MRTADKPWRGVHVASALPFHDDLSVDYDRFADHVRFLAENGCDGICPNGSLGEYQTLSDEERALVVTTAVQAAPAGFTVMAGAAAYGAAQSRRWIDQAGEAGAASVLLLPPNAYRADDEAVVDHYRTAATVGLPIVAYNNPIDTKVDLSPALLARLHGDVRRAYEIAELAPDLDLLIGSDDVLLELGLAGATGWIAGYPNALPQSTVELYRLATSGNPEDVAKALPMYRDLHPLLRWDSKTEFVQAIKLSMDVAGRPGGRCRPPRLPLAANVAAAIVRDTEAALAKGYR